MWSFLRFTLRRTVESESSEFSSSEDPAQCSASSSEDTFEDCNEEPEIGSSPNCIVGEFGVSNLSIYPPLSTIASQTGSMDNDVNFCNESYQSPSKRKKSFHAPKVDSPSGVLSQAAISWTSSPDAHIWHGGDRSSVEKLDYGFAPAPALHKCEATARSACDVTPQARFSRCVSSRMPPCPNFQFCEGPTLNLCNSEHSSSGFPTNHRLNAGSAPSGKRSNPADDYNFSNGFYPYSSNCNGNASSHVLPPLAHKGNCGSNAPSMQFGNSHERSDWTLSGDLYYPLRDCNAFSSEPSSMAVETVYGPTANGSSPHRPGTSLPRRHASSACRSFPATINGHAAQAVPQSVSSNPSFPCESVTLPALPCKKTNPSFGIQKEEEIFTSGPVIYMECGKGNMGAGVLHNVRAPWSSEDELIDQSQEDEGRPEDYTPRFVRGISGVPSQKIQGVKESCRYESLSPAASSKKLLTDPILEMRKDSLVTSALWPPQTEHLTFLGTLDFSTQVFPVLTRLRGKILEEAFTLEELRAIARQPKEGVSQYLLSMDGLKGWSTPDRPPRRCDAETNNYVCRVKPTGKLIFELVEEKKQAKSLLQRTLGFDKVLKVAFDADVGEDGNRIPLSQTQASMYTRFAKTGIFVGSRRYLYFAHKASDKFEKKKEGNVKCFFVCTDSRAEADLKNTKFRRFNTIAEARCLFMHIHRTENIAKYIARMQLVLSRTMTIDVDWSKVVVKQKNDLQCKDESGQDLDGISTDGTGFISTNLARMIPTSMMNGRQKMEQEGSEDYPSLIQVRVFDKGAAYKGTLLASKALPPNTIKCYKSMQKVERDKNVVFPSLNSLEVVSTSQKPRVVQSFYTAKLSRDLIMLLTACGVPGSYFIELVKAAIDQNCEIFKKRAVAVREVLEWGTEKSQILVWMIGAGIHLTEPFLHKSLLDIIKRKMEDLTTGKVNLPESFYLMGTADPTGTLKRNQVAIVLSDGLVYCPKLLVYRAPGKHPGDIHVFEAIGNAAIQGVIGSGKYVIYFSTQGSRPIAEEIGKGDLDGDRYWVCKNTQLVSKFKEYHCRWEKPVSKTGPKMLEPGDIQPADLSPDELEENLFKLYMKARFATTSLVGKIANLWLKQMDRYLHTENPEEKALHLEAALKLAPLYYDALDAPKSGKNVRLLDDPLPSTKTPHYMEHSPGEETYQSKSITGQIYDLAKSEELRSYPSYENFEPDETFLVENYQSHYNTWADHFKIYKREMCLRILANQEAEGSSASDLIYLKYRKMLYGGVSSYTECKWLGTKEPQRVLEEASAIYAVVYSSAVTKLEAEAPRLSFVWYVAGEALCALYTERKPYEPSYMSYEGLVEFNSISRKKSVAKNLFPA